MDGSTGSGADRINTAADVGPAIERFRADYDAVRSQISRAVVGQSEVVGGVLTCLFCHGHVLLEGVPGLGKTLLIRSLARALNLRFSRIQFTPDLMPADISGTTILVESDLHDGSRAREFRFQKGPVFAQIVLADEINRATPKTQSALLEAMQERSITVGGQTHPLEEPFLVMATQNPLEQEGTYPLPEAQLDRFFFKLIVGYSNREDMSKILDLTTAGKSSQIDPVLDGPRILEHQRLVQRAAIAPHVKDYAVRLVMATHPKGPLSDGAFATPMVNQFVRVGASPRGAQSLVLAAKCSALLAGRPAASIEDVQSAALPALRHRVILNFEGEAEGLTTDDVVRNIIETTPVESAAAVARTR